MRFVFQRITQVRGALAFQVWPRICRGVTGLPPTARASARSKEEEIKKATPLLQDTGTRGLIDSVSDSYLLAEMYCVSHMNRQ